MHTLPASEAKITSVLAIKYFDTSVTSEFERFFQFDFEKFIVYIFNYKIRLGM